MNSYAIKFREKGSKTYISVIFQATTLQELNDKVTAFIKSDDYDVDRRTISWAGGSIPLQTQSKPLVIYGNLDDLT